MQMPTFKGPLKATLMLTLCVGLAGVGVDARAQVSPAITPPSTPAASSELPSPESLFEKHIEAIGGEENARRHTSIKFTGTIRIPAHNYSAFLTTWQVEPRSILTNIESPGGSPMVVASDGTRAWGLTPPPIGTGWAMIEGDRLQDLLFSADFYGEIGYKSRYTKLQTIERSDFDGTRCWKVYAESHSGKKFFLFFDQKSGLLVGTHTELNEEGVSVPLIVILDEYIEVDGVKYVTGLTQRTPAMDTVISYRKIEPNPSDVPAIEPPEELKADK